MKSADPKTSWRGPAMSLMETATKSKERRIKWKAVTIKYSDKIMLWPSWEKNNTLTCLSSNKV